MRMIMSKKIFFLSLLFLTGCAAGVINGNVSTAMYNSPPLQPLFIIVSPNPLSLTDRNINTLISQKMIEQGYIEAKSIEDAKVAVLYNYSIGAGVTSVSSSPDFVWGGQRIESTTVYPRFFQIIIVDLERSNIPDRIEIIWQGEIYSKGSSSNIYRLAQYFLDVLFENYGKTVTNKRFYKLATW